MHEIKLVEARTSDRTSKNSNLPNINLQQKQNYNHGYQC